MVPISSHPSGYPNLGFLFLQQSLPKRMPSPSPSNGSTTSSTSLVSEGRKSTTSAGNNAQGGKKFGKSLISRNF